MNLDRFSQGIEDPAHEDCIQEYAIDQLMPATKTIEEALGLEGGF